MIYTLTLSPAIDYYVTLPNLEKGKINKAFNTDIKIGGKGINVSLALNKLNTPSTALGFIGGFTGEYIECELNKLNIKTNFIKTKNLTRINMKINDKNAETAINSIDKDATKSDINKLKTILNELSCNDYLVISGAVFDNLLDDLLSSISKDVKIILDIDKNELLNLLKYKPFLVKPNIEELGRLFNTEINSISDAKKYALELCNMGATNVLVSLGEDGAILASETECLEKKAIKLDMPVVSTVCAGDAMVASFIYKYLESNSVSDAFNFSVVYSSLKVFSSDFPSLDDVNKYLK